MAFSTSNLMRLTMADILGQVPTTMSQMDLDLATNLFAALFDNNVVPDKDAATTLSGYAQTSSTWQATGGQTGGNQVYHTGQWAQHGIVVPSTAITTPSTGVVKFTSGNLVSGATATMSNIYGMMLYFNNQTTGSASAKGVLGFWNFAGAPFSVTAGTLTITPNASGLFTLTV